MVGRSMKVEIWSDVVCPWCYIGKRRFERALQDFPHPVELSWHSFQLDPRPSSPAEGSYADRLARKYGVPVTQAQQMLDTMTAAAAAEGLDFRFDLARSGNTMDAHRLLHHAGDRQDALKERLLRAYFTEGQPIADASTLAVLAGEVGITDAAAVLATDRYRDAVRADLARAEDLGITGVPFFLVDGRYAIPGAQSPEVVLRTLTKAWETRIPALVTVAEGDTCGVDGC